MSGLADASGSFLLAGVEPGRYILHAEAEGLEPVEYKLELRPRQVLALDVRLNVLRGPATQVEVREIFAALDPGQTASGQLLTREELDALPASVRRDVPTLARYAAPGAILSHDNFVHVRGNELSLHEFLNGVSFLDNSHQQFTPGLSPQIFETANVITGGFAAEYGNRFGGILDITTRSGRNMNNHGTATVGLGTNRNRDASLDFGGSRGRFGYYLFAASSETNRFLNPPTREESHDFGNGLRLTAQLDWEGQRDAVKLLLTGEGSRFQLANTPDEQLAGRDAARNLRAQTALLNWQHMFSPGLLLTTSVYERNVSDHLLGTTDTEPPFGEGSRSTLTVGVKSDVAYTRGRHTLKAGLDLSRLRLRESFTFDPREEDAEPEPFAFRGGDRGGEAGLYVEDRILLPASFTLETGVRWDRFKLVGTYGQVSPRVSLARYFSHTRSVIHFAYNRFFAPPPLEYVALASFLGNNLPPTTGNVQPYRQNYFEVGWTQELRPKLMFGLTAYLHRGRNSYETSEISNTRLFLPTNFHRAHAEGAEVSLTLRPLARLGLSGKIQYAVARVEFFGPISGGFADETVPAGERVLPAFDELHTGMASLFFRRPWHDLWFGFVGQYGSGTPQEVTSGTSGDTVFLRLPQHFTANLSAGLSLWKREQQSLGIEINAENVTDSRYRIAKESETTPTQFFGKRVVQGRLVLHF